MRCLQEEGGATGWTGPEYVRAIARDDDAHAARDFLFRLRVVRPETTPVRADSACGGELATWAKDRLRLTVKTVDRSRARTRSFVLLPKRWVAKRSLSWVMSARRDCRDHEKLPEHAEAHPAWTVMALMARRHSARASWREPRAPPGPTPPLSSSPAT